MINIENTNISSILKNIEFKNNTVHSIDFMSNYKGCQQTISSFGNEWSNFTHNDLSSSETASNEYFDIFPLSKMQKEWVVADVGCGTGRWARRIAPKVKLLFGVDPSDALNVFINNTINHSNIIPVKAYAENLPFQDSSLDLVISYGVLHHIKQTENSIIEINRSLKQKGVFLFYFYYNLENRSYLYKLLFKISNYQSF